MHVREKQKKKWAVMGMRTKGKVSIKETRSFLCYSRRKLLHDHSYELRLPKYSRRRQWGGVRLYEINNKYVCPRESVGIRS